MTAAEELAAVNRRFTEDEMQASLSLANGTLISNLQRIVTHLINECDIADDDARRQYQVIHDLREEIRAQNREINSLRIQLRNSNRLSRERARVVRQRNRAIRQLRDASSDSQDDWSPPPDNL
jgi:hypothetical protein